MKQWLVFLFLCAAAPAGFSWDKDSDYTSPPLLNGRTATVETSPMLFAPANQKSARLSVGWFETINWNELSLIAGRLVKKAGGFNKIKSYNNLSFVIDKRFFLVSINPDVLLVIPHRFTMIKDRTGQSVWHDGSISNELQGILKEQRDLYRLNYFLGGLQSAGFTNWVEMSSIFPNVEGILVLSDFYETAVPLSDVEKNQDWPFKSVLLSNMPHFIQLVPK